MNERILYTKPSITSLEAEYAADAAANGWGQQCYDYIIRFEKMFREHLDVGFAIATSSCTGAMHMGLAALDVGRGDEVILADTNWIATAAPIVHLGATPVFVDIDPVGWCIDPEAAERAITPRTKAIIATHLYGNLADMGALLRLAKRHGVAIIEDSAEAIGSVWLGDRRAGSMGRFGTFSFHGTKTITTGEGGMFVTNDEALYEKVLTLSNHGRARAQKKQFWPDAVGFKYKMSNIQAALGCAQMMRIGELTDRKRQIFRRYRALLGDLPGVAVNPEPAGTINGAWMPTAVIDRELGITREDMTEAFASANIDARVFFHPLSSLPMFSPRPENVHAWDIPERAINLPSYHDMTDEQIARVAAVITHLVERRNRSLAEMIRVETLSAAQMHSQAKDRPSP
ncbi:MAG TPA: glutamine--scyllo-inositol aminotransferase [Rhizobium sp.]|nr:glutamine--scyllo-inositol aminotransferase [Rhizobium sp.]